MEGQVKIDHTLRENYFDTYSEKKNKTHLDVKKPLKVIEFKKFYLPFIKIFIPCFLYAFFRYTINHNEPWYDIPFYLMNKVFGVVSVIMMGIAYLIGPLCKVKKDFQKYLGHRKYLGVGGFFLGACHGIMSAILMIPENYPVFYNLETGRLNFQGNLSMFFGTMALFHLCFLAIISLPSTIKDMNSKQWKNLQRTGIIALIITAIHIISFGYKSWFNLEKWYGGMPPFSMMGTLSIFLILIARFIIVWYGNRKMNDKLIVKDNKSYPESLH